MACCTFADWGNATTTAAYHPWQGSVTQAIVSWARATPEECTPDLLHLKDNYRSHKGILEAAGVVLDLIMFFFKGEELRTRKNECRMHAVHCLNACIPGIRIPILSPSDIFCDANKTTADSVDSLEKDTSTKEGYKPEFVKEDSLDGLDKHLFSMGIETGECELGADQVILVRNEATQKEVRWSICPDILADSQYMYLKTNLTLSSNC